MAMHTWTKVQQRHQILLDLRTEIDKANVRLNKFVHTFRKTSCNVWQDKPSLSNYEEVIPSQWHPSVHHLEECSQIVQIVGDNTTSN